MRVCFIACFFKLKLKSFPDGSCFIPTSTERTLVFKSTKNKTGKSSENWTPWKGRQRLVLLREDSEARWKKPWDFLIEDSNNKEIVTKQRQQSWSPILQRVHQTVEKSLYKSPDSWTGKRIAVPTVSLATASKQLSFWKSIVFSFFKCPTQLTWLWYSFQLAAP